MNSAAKTRIEDVVCEVIETFAFMLPDPAGPDEPALNDPADPVKAVVGFEGAAEGHLTIYTSLETAMEMSCNVLGLDQASEDQALDAVQEFANQCCGQLLTALAGSAPAFSLGIPDSGACPVAAWRAALEGPETLHFVVDGEFPLLVRFDIEADQDGLLQ